MFDSQQELEILLDSKSCIAALWPIQTSGHFPGGKVVVNGNTELCHSALYNVEFRNKWSCFPLP